MMLHRVLPASDPRASTSLPEWTVEPALLDECLRFFKRHYNVVTLRAVIDALDGGPALPPRSLLLTFDDGYADNEEYALPLLHRHAFPAVVFVTSDVVGRHRRVWTEDFWFAHVTGAVAPEDLAAVYRTLNPGAPPTTADAREMASEVVTRWAGLEEGEADSLLALLREPIVRLDEPHQMVTAEQLHHLHANGVAIGAHGRSHVALTATPDLESELREPRRTLAKALGLPSENEVDALAFPFGEHSPELVDRALDAGYRLTFTMGQALQPAPGGRLSSRLVRRVNLDAATFAPGGHFRPELAALILAHMPRAADFPPTAGERVPVNTPVQVPKQRPARRGGGET
jgi:peptidoglycan/xylan/chitin deacetylase (PgdA/CDA1 family)